MRLWRKRKKVADMITEHKGYELRSPEYQTGNYWAAYSGGYPSFPWFTAKTRYLLEHEIDEALGAVPPPVRLQVRVY